MSKHTSKTISINIKTDHRLTTNIQIK